MANNDNNKKKRRRGGIAASALPLAIAAVTVVGAVFGALYFALWRDTTPHVLYKAYYTGAGWDARWSMDGDTCGTLAAAGASMASKPIEAFRMELENLPASASIDYAGYVKDLGWKDAKNGGDIMQIAAGGVLPGLEAIRASLNNAPGYALEYRAHFPEGSSQAGWTEWLGEGILVGTPKSGELMDAFQARLIVADSTVAVFEAKQGAHVDFSDIYFKVGANGFNFELPETARNLARLYKFAQQSCDSLQMQIEGHSSSEGDPAANQQLSEQRAEKVRQWLVNKGVNPAKISSIKGFGSSQPKVPEPPAGSVSAAELEKIRKQNRRISVTIERGCQ
jgi:outer membrane protein OmpA-like peptidoglycan-associated protein